jgi:hypothetical protein
VKEPLPADAAAASILDEIALNASEFAITARGARSPAPIAVATAEPAIALFKNNLLFIIITPNLFRMNEIN